MMNKITDAARRMNVMIEDILALSLLSHKQEKSVHDLEAVLQEVLVLLEERIKETNAQVTTDHLPPACVVKAQFIQLFQNLISNSLKFKKEEVPPVIVITHQVKNIAGNTEGKQLLQIQVSDNGIGFDQEYANSIFGLFARLHGRAKYEGTGLGLGICRKVVENHNGTIVAKSEPGKGATFTIEIPLQQ